MHSKHFLKKCFEWIFTPLINHTSLLVLSEKNYLSWSSSILIHQVTAIQHQPDKSSHPGVSRWGFNLLKISKIIYSKKREKILHVRDHEMAILSPLPPRDYSARAPYIITWRPTRPQQKVNEEKININHYFLGNLVC